MNYIGSKYSLIDFLEKNVKKFTGKQVDLTFFDVFAGTGIVGQKFKKLGYRIISNDIQYYSYCLNRAYVGINNEVKFYGLEENLSNQNRRLFEDKIDNVLDHLNGLVGVEGFIFQNYCPGGTSDKEHLRQYFTNENGKLCDAVRTKIEEWYRMKFLETDEYFYLLASLIEAIDKVANTASVYGAFLKKIKKSAQKQLRLQKIKIIPSLKNHEIYNRDAKELINEVKCDILYIDPPYNHRQYCTNYHVLETIAKYDNPKLNGVTGLRNYENQKSDFCYKSKAPIALKYLVENTNTKYVFLSYNSEGIMSEKMITAVLKQFGELELIKKNYKRFRADIDHEKRKYKSNEVSEYLFCLRKFN